MPNFNQSPSGQTLVTLTPPSTPWLVNGSNSTSAGISPGVGTNHAPATAETLLSLPMSTRSIDLATTGQIWPVALG
jgi:hypothetical protein